MGTMAATNSSMNLTIAASRSGDKFAVGLLQREIAISRQTCDTLAETRNARQ